MDRLWWLFMVGILTLQQLDYCAAIIFDIGGVLFDYRKPNVHACITEQKHSSPFIPLEPGISLVKRCYEQRDINGNRKHQLYILSNFAQESFKVLQQFHQPILNLFDGIVLSSKVGFAKPDARIYQYLLKTYHLNAPDCIFIDDEPRKAQAASAIGMHGITYTHPQKVALQLQQLGVWTQ